jgi:hypothetical protein
MNAPDGCATEMIAEDICGARDGVAPRLRLKN